MIKKSNIKKICAFSIALLLFAGCNSTDTKNNLINKKEFNLQTVGLNLLLSDNFEVFSATHEKEAINNKTDVVILKNKKDDINISISKYNLNVNDYVSKYYSYTSTNYLTITKNFKTTKSSNKLFNNLHISEGTYVLDNEDRHYYLAAFDIDTNSYIIECFSKEKLNIQNILTNITQSNNDYNIIDKGEDILSLKKNTFIVNEVESNLYVFIPEAINIFFEANFNEGHERYLVFQNETVSKRAIILLNDYPFYPPNKENWYFMFGYELIYSDEDKNIVHNINNDEYYYMNFSTKYISNQNNTKYIQIMYFDKLNQFDIVYWLQNTTNYYTKDEYDIALIKLYNMINM